MGRGSRSRETGVKKQPEEFSRSVSRGNGSRTDEKDECLFSFDATVKLAATKTSGITQGSFVAIIPHHTQADKLELFIATQNAGDYRGPHAAKILKCIGKNYAYTGLVEEVKSTPGGVDVKYHIEGRGR